MNNFPKITHTLRIGDFFMNVKQKRFLVNIKKAFIELIQIICGTAIMAMGTALFMVPNKLSTGGFAGVATIFYYLFNLPVGTMMFLLNVPLFIFSFFKIGRKFFFRAIARNAFSFYIYRYI